MPTATARTGKRNVEFLCSCIVSSIIIIMPISAPVPTIFHGNFPEKTPSATDFINVAWGADRFGDPIVYAVCRISNTRPKIKAELKEYKEAVHFLKDKLHEVNILNAKLLFTNKLFKEFSLINKIFINFFSN